MKNLLTAVLVFLVGLLVLGSASAANYSVEKVEVDGFEDPLDPVYVERGEPLDVDVWVLGLGAVDDVKVKAWVGGYEYADVRDVTEMFDVENGLQYKKHLTLEIPDDMEAETYTLYVRVYDSKDEVENTYTLEVRETRHKLVIMDTLLRSSGNALFATVRVENVGDRKEEDIKVTVSMPELGVSASTYIDELTENELANEEEEDSMSTNELFLRVPENVPTGDYELRVTVEYDRGHKVVEDSMLVHVKGVEPVVEDNVVVSVDSGSREVKQGEEVAYKLMFANLGDESVLYSVEVAGEKLWGTSRVDPGFVTVQPDSTGEVYVYLRANEGAQLGGHTFTVKVKSGDTIVEERTLTATVAAKDLVDTSSFTSKKALVIGFGVLVVVLVIIGLIIAFNRMKDEDEPGEIPTSSDGKAYY